MAGRNVTYISHKVNALEQWSQPVICCVASQSVVIFVATKQAKLTIGMDVGN